MLKPLKEKVKEKVKEGVSIFKLIALIVIILLISFLRRREEKEVGECRRRVYAINVHRANDCNTTLQISPLFNSDDLNSWVVECVLRCGDGDPAFRGHGEEHTP
ncbi:MAG: hypothetical protein GY820_31615 [Gammaproteobacteria bacterium]|nr:hypothetical protein [Gammaproteobacteria bacterium]